MQNIQTLAEAYYEDPTPLSRKALVLAAIPLVRSIINRLKVPSYPYLDVEDLQGIGMLGFLEAVERFDVTRGHSLVTFAYRRIRGAIIDYIRLLDVLPDQRRCALARARQAADTLSQAQGEEPLAEEVAAYLGLSLSEYQDVLADTRYRNVVYLHTAAEMERGASLADLLEKDDALDAFEQVDQDSVNAQVRLAFACLSEREQTILRLYYYEGLTQREVGQRLGVTEARISQVLGNIHRKLRAEIEGRRSLAA